MSTPLRIGVLIISKVRLIDLSCIDMFSLIDKTYLTEGNFPAPLRALGRTVEIHYIGATGKGTLTTTTASLALSLTDAYTDDTVAAGKLDILLIPGCFPDITPDEEGLELVRRHARSGTTILSVCSGCYVLGWSGVCEGRMVTGPRILIPALRRKFPGARWDDGQRMVRDGNIWSCGSITNGYYLVAEYMRQTGIPEPLIEAMYFVADAASRELEYKGTLAGKVVWLSWQIVKAVPIAIWRRASGLSRAS
ncbi:ThiJ/PfpI family protein [Aspergillus keveii]|uniref:ThiJ/PfpI family protein n=1 Tax=Aspergillus keveii TaxID=714993 RepID=A0ABR4FLW9_9EURO